MDTDDSPKKENDFWCEYGEIIFLNDIAREKYSEKQIKELKRWAKYRAKIDSSIYVVYYCPNKCGTIVDFILDRYPMSEKIGTQCPECKQFIWAEITDPVIFWDPLTEKEIKLRDLKDMKITDSWQSNYLFRYFLDSLNSFCDEQIENELRKRKDKE